MSYIEIQEQALQLDPGARLRLAHALVSSISAPSPEALRDLWLDEAERRDHELESGSVSGVPGQAVFDRIRAKHA